jgi:hypothetical protein
MLENTDKFSDILNICICLRNDSKCKINSEKSFYNFRNAKTEAWKCSVILRYARKCRKFFLNKKNPKTRNKKKGMLRFARNSKNNLK